MGIFSVWTFVGLIFYIIIYVGGFIYIKVGLLNRMREEDDIHRKKQRFDWCWERANVLLKSMPGGQGLQWASGVGRKSMFKSYHDGVQNKPYRSMLAHLEESQQLVLIIFDIDGDDIAMFTANPPAELIENPFLTFRPFTRGVGNTQFSNGGQQPYSRYNQYNQQRRRPGGININVDPQPQYSDEQKSIGPSNEVVDKAVNALERRK